MCSATAAMFPVSEIASIAALGTAPGHTIGFPLNAARMTECNFGLS